MKELSIIIFVHCVYEIFTQIEAEILLFFPDKIFRQQNSRDFLSEDLVRRLVVEMWSILFFADWKIN